MRVVELGLRELADHLKAKTIIKKLKQTKVPIELGTWEEIIGTLEVKLDGFRKLRRGHKREKKIETCTELLKQFRDVKDLFRNKVMHTRVRYDEKQAESAFDHVSAFMLALSETIENKG
jgi:maltooligosyltrehalose synthase